MNSVSLLNGSLATLDAEEQDGAALAKLLCVNEPMSWPPEGNDRDTRNWMRNLLQAHPESPQFVCYYVIAGARLVGNCGFAGPPAPDGRVEIGYGIIAEEQRKGYATAATAALVELAFKNPGVVTIAAETLVDHAASQKVLLACGFKQSGIRTNDEMQELAMFERGSV